MQAVCSTSTTFKGLTVARRAAAPSARPIVRARVVCAAQQTPAAKLAAAIVAAPALLAAHPAFALVDERLAGEGTGKILGIGSFEGWGIIGAFTAVWIFYFISQKDLGGDDGEDSGLTL